MNIEELKSRVADIDNEGVALSVALYKGNDDRLLGTFAAVAAFAIKACEKRKESQMTLKNAKVVSEAISEACDEGLLSVASLLFNNPVIVQHLMGCLIAAHQMSATASEDEANFDKKTRAVAKVNADRMAAILKDIFKLEV